MLRGRELLGFIAIVYVGYPIAFIVSFYGHEKILMLAVFWSAIAGSTITNKYYIGKIKLLIILIYIVVCFALNIVFSEFSGVDPKSVLGFAFSWLIFQGGMFIALVAMYSFATFISSKSRTP